MDRAYVNINIPNIISVGIIAGVLYLGWLGFNKFVMKKG